jgi:hypothetical protein
MAIIKLIGDAPNQISRNKDLGDLAYQSSESAIIESGRIDLKGGGSNLLLRSEEFDNAYWPKFQTTVTANSTTAPDGTTTADSLVNDGTNNYHGTRFAPFTANSEPKTLSVFFKANQITNVSISLTDSGGYLTNGAVATFDLTAGTVSKTGGAAYVSSSITALADGWYRCSLTAQNSGLIYGWFWLNSTNNPTYAGFGYETFSGTAGDLAYIWGAQLEQSSALGNYIATTTSAITLENAPGATALSVIPTTGFDTTYPLAFELASDTSLVVKVKGSDGTVRSVALTLA